MATSSSYQVPPASTPSTNETGMQPATSASVIGRGGITDAAAVNGANIGAPIAAWQFTKVPPS